MAYYRNRYHAEIARRFSDYEYALVLDLDLEGGVSLDGIANSFGWDEWDVIGSNGIMFRWNGEHGVYRRVHFDAWAFRSFSHPEPHDMREVNAMQFKRGDALIPVMSSFGGAALYRMSAFLSSRYVGDDCEHVSFHLAMRDRGYCQQFLNPSQVSLYGGPPRACGVESFL